MIRRGLHCPRCADYPEQIRDMHSVMGSIRLQLDDAYAGMVGENNELRAQLMQLRVTPGSQRKGFAVAAFIPQDVLDRMKLAVPESQAKFIDKVARVLVEKAIMGLFHMEPSGEVTSIVFAPVSTHPKDHRRIATCFGDGHKISYPLGAELLPGADKIDRTLEAKKRADSLAQLQMLASPGLVHEGLRLRGIQDEIAPPCDVPEVSGNLKKCVKAGISTQLMPNEQVQAQFDAVEEQQVPDFYKPKPKKNED